MLQESGKVSGKSGALQVAGTSMAKGWDRNADPA
jgi:hypothetical protein